MWYLRNRDWPMRLWGNRRDKVKLPTPVTQGHFLWSSSGVFSRDCVLKTQISVNHFISTSCIYSLSQVIYILCYILFIFYLQYWNFQKKTQGLTLILGISLIDIISRILWVSLIWTPRLSTPSVWIYKVLTCALSAVGVSDGLQFLVQMVTFHLCSWEEFLPLFLHNVPLHSISANKRTSKNITVEPQLSSPHFTSPLHYPTSQCHFIIKVLNVIQWFTNTIYLKISKK